MSKPSTMEKLQMLAGKAVARARAAPTKHKVAAAAVSYFTWVMTRKSTRRVLKFWAAGMPMLMSYKNLERKMKNRKKYKALSEEEKSAMWEKLHQRYAPKTLKLFTDLRGLYVKFGQVMTTRADITPPVYMRLLSTLQDEAPCEPLSTVRRVVREDTGKELEELFAEFEEKPIGSASIAQVHVARLHDGRRVVVKVQYPGAKKLMKLDLGTARKFTALANKAMLPFMDEMERQFLMEFDFSRERWALETIADELAMFGDAVQVPRPIEGMSTARMLVMDYVDGVKVADPSGHHLARPAAEALRRTGESLDGLPDAAVFLKVLMEVHGVQIFRHGVFNADPHPGNVYLLNRGGIGLIDFGQTKVISRDARVRAAKLLRALAEGSDDDKVAAMIEAGFRTKKMRPEMLLTNAILFFDDERDLLESHGMNIHQITEWLNKEDPMVSIPQDLIMIMRVCMMLKGIGSIFGHPVRPPVAWAHFVEEVLERPEAMAEYADKYNPEYIKAQKKAAAGKEEIADEFED
eukprot:PLAT7441.1.p2 GENE.PLAT7441.1~~PLAT7441.1.p2  ORF type:complete len:520 (+),score=322.66 PLAT7441.1:105-1664(+)